VRRLARIVVLAAPLGLALTAPSGALATEGSLYAFGVEALVGQSVYDGQCSVVQQGASFGVTCPPRDPSLAGPKWQIDLRTPVAGSAIEAFSFRAVRFHETPTSIGPQVLADGAPIWGVAERDIPRAPEAPKAYQVGLSGQTASLRLNQSESRRQPNRVWTFLEPTIRVRDLAAPGAQLLALPPGWITTNEARVVWQATDNFGADGVGQQRLFVSGGLRWAGAPGLGPHSVSLGLTDVLDGAHEVRLEVDGDGTAGAPAQRGTIYVDRTPPTASVDVTEVSGGRVRLTVAVSDATSGMQQWTLRPPDPGAPAIATGTTVGAAREIALADYLTPGQSTRFVLEARDQAGNLRSVLSAAVTRSLTAGAVVGPPPTTVLGPEVLGLPGEIERSGAALPNFSRVQSRGLRSHSAQRYVQSGEQLVPVLLAQHGRPVRLAGRFAHPRGRGLRGATVYLVDPFGRTQGTTLTDRGGGFRFQFRPRVAGVWRAIGLGRPLLVAPALLRLRPFVRVRVFDRTLRPGETLRVAGVIRPRARAGGKIVQLQWRQGDRWSVLSQSRADRTGRFRLRFRTASAGGGYSIRMRVVVPAEKGWPFAPLVARRFEVEIG
jgi:hypothetical protein